MNKREKVCSVCFDEMALMKKLEYSFIIEGFEDLGCLGRTNKIANGALVFMLRGVYSRWKLPLMYVVSSNSVKGENLKTLILLTVEKVIDCGLIPVCVECDQGSKNRSALSKLGVAHPFFLCKRKENTGNI